MILVDFVTENAANDSNWRSQLGHAIQDFELDPFGAVTAIENAAKGIPVIEDITAHVIDGYHGFVHWGTDFTVESYDSISDFLNKTHDYTGGVKESLGDAYQERVGCPRSSSVLSKEQYGELSQEIVIQKATDLYPTSKNRPAKMSCVIDIKRGVYYIGESGREVTQIHPVLKARMPEKSLKPWAIQNCAEFQAVNAALFDGADLRDLVGSTIYTNFMQVPPCTTKDEKEA